MQNPGGEFVLTLLCRDVEGVDTLALEEATTGSTGHVHTLEAMATQKGLHVDMASRKFLGLQI